MFFVIIEDGIDIYFKDWGFCDVQFIMFYYGWFFLLDDWDVQMFYFFGKGFCVVVSDCCGYGCFLQIVVGYDMDYYVSDVNVVVEYFDLQNVVYIGYLIGGGQVVCYVVKYGQFQGCVVKVVFVFVVLLLMFQIEVNFEGIFFFVFDGFCEVLVVNCVEFFQVVVLGLFYGFNCDGVEFFEFVVVNWWCQGMIGSVFVYYEGIKVFFEIDQIEDFKVIMVLVFVFQGDDDQVVLYKDVVFKQYEFFVNLEFKIYEGFLYGMLIIYVEVINFDIFVFIQKQILLQFIVVCLMILNGLLCCVVISFNRQSWLDYWFDWFFYYMNILV